MFKTPIRPFCDTALFQIKDRIFALFYFRRPISDDLRLFLKEMESRLGPEFMLIFAGGLIKVWCSTESVNALYIIVQTLWGYRLSENNFVCLIFI